MPTIRAASPTVAASPTWSIRRASATLTNTSGRASADTM